MSEVNNAEDLVEEVHLSFDDSPTPSFTLQTEGATVIPVPIDPTLTIQGEAADAKATGDAIAAAAGAVKVNNKEQDSSHNITVYATDINMSNESGAQTVAQAVQTVADRTAANIIYDTENLISIKGALDDIYDQIDTELSNEEIDEIIEEVFGGDE